METSLQFQLINFSTKFDYPKKKLVRVKDEEKIFIFSRSHDEIYENELNKAKSSETVCTS